MNKLVPTIVPAALAALVVACGGGSGMSNNASPTGTAPVMATGTITGFGSIYVNGVHFQTTSATIHKNGQVVAQSALKVGEIARIKGAKNDTDGSGNADSIDDDQTVVGPIAKIDAPNNTLTVLGQTVKIDGGTSFSSDVKPADITGLKVTDFVEVSGLTAADGSITATRIERDTSAGTLQVLGTVASVNTAAHTFMINALTVNYSAANLTGFSSGQPANGDVVEIHGTTFDSTTTTLTATRVDRQMSDQEEAGDHRDMEREGLITRYASATDFDVAGKPVTTTGTTVYRNGTAANLALNVKVEVEGSLNSTNVLVADVVSFHRNGGVELQSTVTAMDATAGTLTVLGVPITVTSTTRFEDKSSANVEKFSLSNISVGDTVDVRGFESPAGSGKLVASRLEREPASMEVEVDGSFAAGTSPQFTVFGITVNASSATLRGAGGATLTLADFLTQAVGHSVKVSGQLSGTIVTASEARIHAPSIGND
jgi:Domain of unknown function (DUF5666)